MSERLKFQGRLREKEIEARGVQIKCEGLIKSIRDCLDPFEELPDIKADIAAQQAVELAALQADYRALLAEIAEIKKALGK